MFGLEILDIVIGLTFIYLLLALMATAVNEYISSLLNKRGKELAKGISRLLEDVEGKAALDRAWAGVSASARMQAASLTEQFYSHRLIRPLATRRGLLARLVRIKEPRLPSYIPARTFTLAFLDILGYHDADATRPTSPGDATPPKPVSQREELADVLELLKRESPLDVSEHLPTLKKLITETGADAAVHAQLAGTVVAAQTRLQKLHDSTEVWFNNSMDRVSGSYKRHVQAMLFIIGVGIAVLLNADTIQLWKRLATDDALRTAVAQQAARYAAAVDTAAPVPARPTVGPAPAPGDTVDPQEAAARKYRAAKATLDSMQLQLGWTWEEAARLGFAARDRAGKAIPGLKWVDPQGWRVIAKLIGLLLTALAISMGAPFWFDTLNRVIKVRAAGRSPVERLKSPGGPAKRAAEQPTK